MRWDQELELSQREEYGDLHALWEQRWRDDERAGLEEVSPVPWLEARIELLERENEELRSRIASLDAPTGWEAWA